MHMGEGAEDEGEKESQADSPLFREHDGGFISHPWDHGCEPKPRVRHKPLSLSVPSKDNF